MTDEGKISEGVRKYFANRVSPILIITGTLKMVGAMLEYHEPSPEHLYILLR